VVDPTELIIEWRTEMWLPQTTRGLPDIPLLAPAAAGLDDVRGLQPGLISQNADPPYRADHVQVLVHWLKDAPLRPAPIRSPGKPANCFAVESFTDELVACAFDCGQIVNPDGVRAQVEGSILQTLSRVLMEEVQFDRSRVTSVDWSSYPILRFPDVPKLDIVLIDRPTEPPLGAGEAACAPVGAALANAVFDASGARLRIVPFTPERVKSSLDGV